MKTHIKRLLVHILGNQVKMLRKRHNITVVAVVGSIGKTSTKFAIANMLGHTKKVRWQEGNYNHLLTVPLVFFGHQTPNLANPFAWTKIIIRNQLQMKHYPYEVVVVELGTDGPGQLIEFKQYLHVDTAVVTAVAPEHMDFFKTLDAVGTEELSVSAYSKNLVINTDLVDKKYYKDIKKPITTYGSKDSDITLKTEPKLTLRKNNKVWLTGDSLFSGVEGYSRTAAAVVAHKLGVSDEDIQTGLSSVHVVPGRMQVLDGIKESTIIDDTYNSSPDATIAALHTLYQRKNNHKIALLGNMNELGEFSKEAHESVGAYCDPKQLELVVTVGPDANSYLAPAAEANGCKVKTFDNPYEAGEYVKKHLKPKSIVLAKGSQNNVYMEEAVKKLLAHPKDAERLVRQSANWHKKKQKNFNQ